MVAGYAYLPMDAVANDPKIRHRNQTQGQRLVDDN
jgi:hypothetical protein